MKKLIVILFLLTGCAHPQPEVEVAGDEKTEETDKTARANSQKEEDVEEKQDNNTPSETEKTAKKEAEEEPAENTQGDFKYFEGDVKVRESEEEKWVAVDTKTKVQNGTQINLGNGSYAHVTISDTINIDLNEETAVEVEQKDEDISLDMFYGAIKAKTENLSPGQLEIRTPVSVTGVRGTDFEVIYEEKNKAETGVYEGEVEVQNREKSKKQASINAGKDKVVQVDKNQKPRIIGTIDEIRELRWVHLEARKKIFVNRRRIRFKKARLARLKRSRKIAESQEKKEKLDNVIESLSNELEVLKMAVVQNNITLSNIKERYARMRKEKAAARRKLIDQKREEIIERRKENLKKKRKQRLKERKR
ncbi:MAG: FecR family protein [Elusimicrobiota bacterium]